LAAGSGVSLEISSSILPAKDKSAWPSSIFQISLAGPPPDFLKFVDKLESGQYLAEIQSFDAAGLSESELKSAKFEKLSSGDIKANLTIKVFTK